MSSPIACNSTSSGHHFDDDHTSASQMLGFGSGAGLSAYHLIFGFSLSMIIGTIGEGLDLIETLTQNTTYHLMLQRIYRQLMTIGLISFGLSFTTFGGSPFPAGYMNGFEFGDYTLFITAIYFCLQGLWTMIASNGLGNAWDRASKITTEELHMDVDRSHKTSCVWKRMFYPFSVTRNQVEFRIFQSIFSSAYSISTKHTELDFGLFLKMTHENNLMNIIDFDSWKGCLVLILIGLASIKVQFYHSACDNPICEAEEEIWIFTCCGVVILLLSILLFYWGRKSELLLIQKSGVESIDDYQVFLMVESQMHAQFEKNVLKTSNVKTAINELMVEAESNKLEAESKMRKQKQTRLYHTAHLVASLVLTTKVTKDPPPQPSSATGGSTPPSDPKNRTVHSKDHEAPPIFEGGRSEVNIQPFDPPVDSPREHSFRPSRLKVASSTIVQQSSSYNESPESKVDLESKGDLEFQKQVLESLNMSPMSPKTSSSLQFLQKFSPQKLFSNSSTVVPVVDPDLEANIPMKIESPPISSTPSSDLHNPPNPTSQSPWTKAKQLLRKLSSVEEGDQEKEKTKIKTKMKVNINHQLFPEIFLFHSPLFFYTLLHLVITCNSLYLALWTTNFAIIANRGDDKGHTAMLIILSILPALFALPFVSQAIKSSSILKAVTKLNLDVVSSVVEKTQDKIQLVASFRHNLTHFLLGVSHNHIVRRTAVNQLYEEFNTNVDGLTFDEFVDLIQGCNLHVPKYHAKIIFAEMDINRDESINMEEFERFLFPEETILNDKKKQKFFEQQNQKMLDSLGKHDTAKRILRFLDPHVISRI